MSFDHPAARERLAALPADTRIAVVTGASSGIGEATARELARQGFHVVVGARRLDRLQTLADEIGGTAIPLDVTDPDSCEAFCAAVPRLHVLVNNAGGAKGTTTVMDADEEQWRWMWETNVLGTLRLVRGLMPVLVDTGDGLVVTITSIAALESYDKGSGYTTAKHAQAVLHRTLRGEHLGQPVRFTEIAPGMVETEFSLVRFDGDDDKAGAVYQGLTPMVAQDIAEVVGFVASRPSHVNLDQIVVKPRDQHSAMRAHRRAVD
ncbi:MAG: SDR family NAD(P)-dependent oxidoreductase [Dietzia sp.]